MITKRQPYTVRQTSTMYHMVFGSRFAQLGAMSLLAFLLIQPVAPAFASELIGEGEVDTTTIEGVENVASLIEAFDEDMVVEEDSVEDLPALQEETGLTSEETYSEDIDASTLDEVSGEDEPQEQVGTSTEEIPEAIEVIDGENGFETTQDPDETQEDVDDVEDTDTSNQEKDTDALESTEEEVDESVYGVHTTSAYQFDTKECTSVGDGAYYCSEGASDENFTEDGVFSAPDADGDLEIFVRVAGEESQITHNQHDDSAPYYDALSERIVWHSLIDDRYQVISYDIKTGEEVALTDSTYNNMEPVAYGKATVWQAWLNGNWEIMLLQSGEIKQLTNNMMHDVSPHMRQEHIVWQTQYTEGWYISVYDIQTGHMASLPSEDGAKIENPRFVLVYDTTNEAGDIQTIGYDPDENRSFLLNNIPVELPEELPNPDQTGETRALIQNKASVKGIEIEDAEPTPTPNASSSDPHASSTHTMPTLDMRTSTGTLMSASTTIAMSDIEDLVLPSSTPITGESPIDYVSDLVIPPSASTTVE